MGRYKFIALEEVTQLPHIQNLSSSKFIESRKQSETIALFETRDKDTATMPWFFYSNREVFNG